MPHLGRATSAGAPAAAALAALAVLVVLLADNGGSASAQGEEGERTTLHSPWSLVAVNQGGPVEEVFDGIYTEAVFAWDAEGEAYEIWRRVLPRNANALQELQDGQAVWVRTSQQDSFTQRPFVGPREVALVDGWTLVGWTGPSMPVAAAAAILGAQILIVHEGVDQAFQRYEETAPAFVNTLETVPQGYGLWVFRDSAGRATIPAPEAAAAEPEPEPEAPVLEEVTFQASDGVMLAADLRRGSSEWYLFAHQNGRDRSAWGELPQTASEQFGFSTLAWDFRGFGASDAGERGDIVLDWLAAIEFAASQGATTIFAVGASMSGTSLVVAAASDSRVSSLVLISAPANFVGIDALSAAPDVSQDVFLIAGDADGNAVADAQAIADALGGKKGVRILETDLHGNDLTASDLLSDNDILFPPP